MLPMKKNSLNRMLAALAAVLQAGLLYSCASSEVAPAPGDASAQAADARAAAEAVGAAPGVVSETDAIPGGEYDFARYAREREIYVGALAEYKKGNFAAVRSLLKGDLRDYPLAVNLEYLLLRTPGADLREVVSFIRTSGHGVLSESLRDYHMEKLDERQRYRDVLAVSPAMPESQEQKCLWLKAGYKTGSPGNAVAFLSEKFTRGERLGRKCLNLASLLVSEGKITPRQIYSRVYESYWTRNQKQVYTSAAALLARDPAYAGTIKLLAKYYGNPGKYMKIPETDSLAAVTVFRRYGRLSPRDAMKSMEAFARKYRPTPAQTDDIDRSIIYSLLYAKDNVPYAYIDSRLPRIGTRDMFRQRIRLAIWDRDYKNVVKYIRLLPEDLRQADNYRYWLAAALENLGDPRRAKSIYDSLSRERSFYGYLAADRAGRQYAVNEVRVPPLTDRQKAGYVHKYPAYRRFTEYEYLGDKRGQRTEWKELMNTATLRDARNIATGEAGRGYKNLALWEPIYKQDWDVLSLRFPVTYEAIYSSKSDLLNVPVSFMYGITRQESMMNPYAQSPVGARGLMQLMPATARVVSRRHGVKYGGPVDLFNPEINVNLGAAYLKDMLTDFNGNRIFTSAGYNAGPKRAARWQSRDGICRDLATYVENIPFEETREYVQKVVLYDFMYQHLLGAEKPVFISKNEKETCY